MVGICHGADRGGHLRAGRFRERDDVGRGMGEHGVSIDAVLPIAATLSVGPSPAAFIPRHTLHSEQARTGGSREKICDL